MLSISGEIAQYSLRLTPQSAARRRRVGWIELLCGWLINSQTLFLAPRLQNRTNKNQRLNPDWQTTPEPRKSVLALHGKEAPNSFASWHEPTPTNRTNPTAGQLGKLQDFLCLRSSKERELNSLLALHEKQMH